MSNVRLFHCSKVSAFGKVTAKHLVGVFDATLLPGGVRVSKEDGYTRLLCNELVLLVLDAVVCRHAT